MSTNLNSEWLHHLTKPFLMSWNGATWDRGQKVWHSYIKEWDDQTIHNLFTTWCHGPAVGNLWLWFCVCQFLHLEKGSKKDIYYPFLIVVKIKRVHICEVFSTMPLTHKMLINNGDSRNSSSLCVIMVNLLLYKLMSWRGSLTSHRPIVYTSSKNKDMIWCLMV